MILAELFTAAVIYYMTPSTAQVQAHIEMNIPEKDEKKFPEKAEKKFPEIRIYPKGVIILNGVPISMKQLQKKLTKEDKEKEKTVTILIHKDTKQEKLVELLDMLTELEITKLNVNLLSENDAK